MNLNELIAHLPELNDIFNEATEINASGYFTNSEKRKILNSMKARIQKIKQSSTSTEVRNAKNLYPTVLNSLTINLGL